LFFHQYFTKQAEKEKAMTAKLKKRKRRRMMSWAQKIREDSKSEDLDEDE
jgi:hypothetical protein